MTLRLAYDVTPLLDPRTGVGAVCEQILRRLAVRDDVDVVGYAPTWRGRERLPDVVPAGVRLARGPMAAQPLRQLWRRVNWPPITLWTGKVDVVHGTNFVVPPARRGAARLATVHDLTPVRYPELCTSDVLQYPGLLRRALAGGAHIHAVSEFVAGEVIELLGADPQRVHVVPNGIDAVAGGDASKGHQLAGGDRYVLTLATVEPRKDHPLLVRAFDGLAADDSDVRLVVAGPDGWGIDAYEAAVAAATNRDRIVRLGWVSDEARADLLAGASAFAYPSVYEGFGLPPLEAMSVGVPVVATRAGSLPEVLGDGALLVSPGDADEFAAALTAVLGDESVRADLRAKGLQRVSRYSWDTTAEALVELYRKIC